MAEHDKPEIEDDDPFADADYVIRYTRAQAIKDGTLHDVSQEAAMVGFKHPVAITASVSALCPRVERKRDVMPVLGQAMDAVRRAARGPATDRVRFAYEDETVIVHCGPGDDGEPVITIMLPIDD